MWTKRVPTEDGFYWWRRSLDVHAVVVFVQPNGRLDRMGWSGVDQFAASQGGEWFGPLQEPGGDAVENCRDNGPTCFVCQLPIAMPVQCWQGGQRSMPVHPGCEIRIGGV